jgi:hypothetical protein
MVHHRTEHASGTKVTCSALMGMPISLGSGSRLLDMSARANIARQESTRRRTYATELGSTGRDQNE